MQPCSMHRFLRKKKKIAKEMCDTLPEWKTDLFPQSTDVSHHARNCTNQNFHILWHSRILGLSSGHTEAEWDCVNWWKIVVDVLTLTTNAWQLCGIQLNTEHAVHGISGWSCWHERWNLIRLYYRQESTWAYVLAQFVSHTSSASSV